MVSIKQLREYLSVQSGIFYMQHRDYGDALRAVLAYSPERATFVWEPFRLRCVRWTNSKQDLQDQFNAAVAPHVEFQDLINMIRAGIAQENPGPGKLIPRDSVILCNGLGSFLDDPAVRSNLEQCAFHPDWLHYRTQLLLYSTGGTFPQWLTQLGIYLTCSRLDDSEIREALIEYRNAKPSPDNPAYYLNNPEIFADLVPQLRGLTRRDIRQILRLCDKRNKSPETIDELVATINEIKSRTIQQSEILSYLPVTQYMHPKYLGGFRQFLDYVQKQASAFHSKAASMNIDTPRGVILLGPPGTGKSMAAKSLSYILKLPTLMMDLSSVFGSLMGESESRIRQALRQVDDLDGAILVIDEADKAFAGLTGAAGDGGTARRVFGTVLTWLQDRTSRTFVVMTLNQVHMLPFEFLRAGRFDKIFTTALPTPSERKFILETHARMRNMVLRLDEKQWETVIHLTKCFSGAELEAVIKDSRWESFSARQDGNPTYEELVDNIQARKPMYAYIESKKPLEACATPVSYKEEETEE